MSESKYKYKINYFLGKLDREFTMKRVIGMLEKVGIKRPTFYKDRNVQLGESYSIPEERLEKYAKFFGVSTDQLKNYEPQGLSLNDLVALEAADKEKTFSKFKLSK